MIAHQWVYLISASLFFIYWFALWFYLRDQASARKSLLKLSCLFAILGPISALVWFNDWWRPATILGYQAGIEDAVLGFTNGGLATHLYLFFFNAQSTSSFAKNWQVSTLLILYIIIVTLGLLYFQLNSFYANIFGLTSVLIVALSYRRDLWLMSVISGLALLLATIPVYALIYFLAPTWIDATWNFTQLSGYTFLKVPIEDYIWYFMLGSALSLILPVATGQRFTWRFFK